MAPYRKQQLTPILIRNLGPGRHADGDGLYLMVEPSGSKRWLLRTVVDGKRRDIGLGGYNPGFEPKASTDMLSAMLHPGSIAQARREAARMRAIARAGGDPLAARKALRQQERAKRKTFRDFATDYIAAQRPSWTNPKHAAQWSATMETYAYPVIGDYAIGTVERAHIVTILKPIWTTKPETASRVRGRIETILDAAKAEGLRTGDNPAAWRGNLEASLAKQGRGRKAAHHAALPYSEIAAFVAALREQPGTAARALEFAILTAARTGEVIGARWDEIDEAERVWDIPEDRMKAKKPHRVPLSPRAIEIINGQPRAGEFLFATTYRGKLRPLSNMAMLAVLERMKRDDITVHGFRSSFRDWAGETTAYPREVIEHALAHKLADKAEAAYQRGDMLRKRRALMDDWATYCATERPAKAEVTPIRRIQSSAAA